MKQHDAKQNEMLAMQPKAESSPGSSRMRLRSRLRRNFWIVLPVLLLMGANLLAPSVQAQQMPTATEAPTRVVIPFVNRDDDGNPICEDLPRNVRFNVIFGEDDKDRPDDYDPNEDSDPADPDDKYRQSCESVEALKIRVQDRWCNSDARIRGIPDEYKDVLPNGSYVKLYNLCPNSCRACADTCADSRPAFTVTTEKPDPVTGKKTNRRCTYLDKRTDATAARLCRNKEIELKRGRVQYRIKPLQEQCPRTCGKFGEGKCAAFLADEGPPTETKIQLACPEIGDPPKVISESANYDFVELQLEVFQGTDVLCTLVEMDVDLTEGESEDAFSNLKPVGRSYNGNNWEAAPGDFSSSSFQCSGSCSIRLPRTSGNRLYVLRSYDYGHTLGPDDIVARFLERTTFGPTKPEIQEFASREAWLSEQFALPSTSHREFFRKRATGYSYFTSRTGLLHTGPCEEGSQYRSFALTRNDFENYLLVQKSPLDATKLTLSVGGHIRTVVDGPMEVGDGEEMEERTTIDIDIVGTYFRIGDVRTEGKYEGEISLELPSKKGYNRNIYFGGNRGNPRVHFDSTHTSLLENLLVLSQNKYKKILTQQYSGDNGMIEITNPLQSSSCAAWDNEVVGFTNLNKFAIARTEENGDFKYWIHSPVSSLLDNGVDAPLPDGGVKAVRQTTNAGRDQEEIKDFQAKCSNAPRTFLNEDSCRLVEADACSYDEDADIRDGGKVLVCGSPGEVSNHNHQGIDAGPHGKGGFDLYNRVNQTLRDSDLEEQRLNVWAEIALHSNDQLRQRVAYALSQILVITPEDVGTKQSTENFLHYYDIFVKNAFGNYFDILKEVTYSPLMARMLTYRDGVSTGYAYIKDDYIHLADENYAREIMQLFTMGLVLQNDDGTKKLDSDGNEIASYTNLHISEYAKVFVGMSDQLARGNIENGNKRNLVDPLRIMPDWKDKFPKLGLNSKYVGDGYPLCSELPHQHFLKKGAKYRLLGAKRNPDFTNEIISDESTGNVLNSASSTLASILCNEAGDGECNPQNIVILPNDIECDGTECEMSEPRTIEIKKGLWYEYIRPPCVNQAFYNNGKSIYRKGPGLSYKNILCANPAHRDAPTACCEPNSKGDKQIASLKEIFVGERTTFETAVDRCLRDDLNICEAVPDKGLANGIFTWLSAPCSVSVKVSPDGSVGIVHQPSAMAMAGLREGEEVYRSVARDTKSFFRADWQPTVEFSTIQTFLDDFGSNCESSGCTVDALDSNCLCEVSVEDTIAFENVLDLDTAENVLSTATIGSFVPNSATFVSSGIAGIKVSPSREALSMETIFEVTDRLGNTHYRKNIISTAKLGDGSLRMRNPVTFWSLPDVTTRDGEYELDAALEHYFFHPNVPSFLAKVLVQRFGTSNPSPRYVKAIATAFQSGKYKNFGSNKYGCLEATIAAILLDREATNHILDADPIQGQLQGPYMRLMRAMRSLEYQNNPDHPMVRFLGDIYDKIGEEPHKLPNVFSFYEPSYVAPGPAQAANLAAPEAGVLTGQSSISMVKGLMSLMRYGGSNKGDSFFFGGGKKDGTIEFGKNTYNPAKYGLDPESADDVVDDLAMLLTSGRLSLDNRRIIKETFQESISNSMADNPIEEALVSAQQLITLSPEFHSNSVVRKGTKNRETTDDKEAAGVPYKAVIQVMLNGGLDSFSVLVPDSCTGTNAEGTTVDQQYRDVRGPLAFDRSKGEYDLTITPNSEQPCESFAIHEDLPFVKELYDDGDLLFFANVGVVNNNKMNRENWEDKTRARLFSHSSMQQEAIKLDTYEKLPGSGVLGRLNDMLINKFNGTANSIGISDNSNTLRGYETEGAPILVVGKNGPIQFKTGRRDEEPLFDIEEAALKINSEQDVFSSIFGETWSDTFVTGIFDGERLSEFIANNIEGLDSEIWASEPDEDNQTKLKFQTLAEMIQTREDRGVDRDTFSINIGGFDHHAQLKASLKEKLPALNLNLRRLKEQLVKEGLWEHVTIVVQSEFGRTISFNSNDGADHGWGGNYMVLGGGLRGGRVLGKYPDDFTPTSRLNASKNSRVRFMPTTSWEHVFNGIVGWYVEGFDKEVTEEDLDYVIPNRKSVVDPVESEGSHPLYTASDMYNVKAKKNNIFVRQRSS